MSTEEKAVERVETIEPAAVQSDVSEAQGVSTDDLLAVIEAKDSELEKIRLEKENYKKGMLKAKGKLDEDDSDSEDIDAKIERVVAERLLGTKEAQLQAEKDTAFKALAKRNRELETALKNRSQISAGIGGGNNTESMPVSDHVLSADQVKSLKAKGWDDNKIELFKKNLLKNKG